MGVNEKGGVIRHFILEIVDIQLRGRLGFEQFWHASVNFRV